MLRQRLKSGTAEGHRRLEEELNLARTDQTRETYVALLERFWGLYQPLEDRLLTVLERQWPGEFVHRGKLASLSRDLLDLGHTHASLALLPCAIALPPCDTVTQALGVAYVLEGSTLGGQYLARHYAALLGLTPQFGARFFASYGAEVPAMWQRFCALLNTFGESHHDHDVVVAAAQQTFARMQDWLCERAQVVHGAS